MTQACRNALTWFKETNGPVPRLSDCNALGVVLCEDRAYLDSEADVLAHLRLHTSAWNCGKSRHRPWPSANTAVESGRERRAKWALQWVLHRLNAWALIEIDFDRFNPDRGVAPALGHGVEVLWHKLTRARTDPYVVARARGWL